MKKLPSLRAKEVIRILKKFGFQEDRQKGSHLVLINPATKRRAVIPVHAGKIIKKSLLKSVIENDVGVSIEDFLRLRKH